MSFVLRPYQVEAVEQIRAAFARGVKRVLYVLPTGGGKSLVFSHIAKATAARGKTICTLLHRQELVAQASRSFSEMDVLHGIIAAGRTPLPTGVQVASVHTLVRRLARYNQFDLLIIDEAHHTAAGSWQKILDANKRAYVLGVTATPERLDGHGLAHHFEEMIVGPTISDLIEQGYLSPFRIFAPSTPDLSTMRKRGGDYANEDLAMVMNKSVITGDAVAHYRRLAEGKRALAFAVNVQHSESIAAEFRAAGFAFQHLDGNTDRADRIAGTSAFAEGRLQGMTNCDLFSEGYDVPGAEAAILVRPTASLPLYLQQCGRVFRPLYAPDFDLSTAAGRRAAIAAGPKPFATIIDHAGNCLRHGMPDAVRKWSLDGRKARKKEEEDDAPSVRQCPNCYCMCLATSKACPACGLVFEVVSRVLEHVEGDLVEVVRDTATEWLRAMSYREAVRWADGDFAKLLRLATARGYRRGWARHQVVLADRYREKAAQ